MQLDYSFQVEVVKPHDYVRGRVIDREKQATDLNATMVDHIGVERWFASNAFVSEMYRRAAKLGFEDLSVADGNIMGHLPYEGISIVGLAKRRGATKQATHEAVRRLTKRGILELLPDPNDRRAKRVVHSERGLAFEKALQDIKRDMHREVEDALGRDGLSDLERALKRVKAMFEEL